MFKRIWLFLFTNLAIIIVFSITLTILSKVFGVEYATVFTWNNYLPVLIFAAVVWFTWSFVNLLISKWIAKRVYKIKIINPQDLFSLTGKEKFVFETVDRISQISGINRPEVWIYSSNDPNAFATWPTKNNSLVAISTWLLDIMNEVEIEWVIAHEMAHIVNWDMVTMVLLQWIINTFVIFISRIAASFIEKAILESEESWTFVYYIVTIILEICLWILASIVVMWFSRYREYRADEWSANFVWKDKMIAWLRALQKMQHMALWDKEKLATMKISTKTKSWFMMLFSSHPNLENRIKNLENFNIL